MSTRAELLAGKDYEGFEGFCDTLVNFLKNHWHQSDPRSVLISAPPGVIASDADDYKLWHKLGDPYTGSCWPSGEGDWDEILQAHESCDTTPIFNGVDLQDQQVKTDTRVRAYLSTDQLSLVSGAWTKVLIDTEDYDTGGNFDTGNNKFVTPVVGAYLIIGMVRFKDMVADRRYVAGIYVNGSLVAQDDVHSSHVAEISAHVSDVQIINSGIDIELYAQSNAGVNTVDIDAGSTETYLVVHLLSI
jgi:hypothetical protein